MKLLMRLALAALMAAAAVVMLGGAMVAQEGPRRDPGETVARPRKPGAPPEPDQAPIPSKLSKKSKPDLPADLPSFKSDVQVVTVHDQAREDDGTPHLERCPQHDLEYPCGSARGAVQSEASCNVLDVDDGVIHDLADRDDEARQHHGVDGTPGGTEDGRRRQQR